VDEKLTLTGVVLLILGIVLFFIPLACLVGIPLAIVGFIVMLVGAIQEGPRPMYAYPPMYAPPYPQVPMAPGQPAMCPRCGQSLTYVPEYQRWFCTAENVYPWG
jgi:hypothetical protein